MKELTYKQEVLFILMYFFLHFTIQLIKNDWTYQSKELGQMLRHTSPCNLQEGSGQMRQELSQEQAGWYNWALKSLNNTRHKSTILTNTDLLKKKKKSMCNI